MTDDVFDDHYSSVNDHSEIQRTQREQVRGNLVEVEANGSEEQREGDGQSDDDRTTDIAQEEEEDD